MFLAYMCSVNLTVPTMAVIVLVGRTSEYLMSDWVRSNNSPEQIADLKKLHPSHLCQGFIIGYTCAAGMTD